MWYKFFPQASEDAKESSLLEQTLEPDNTLLSVFPHDTRDERYIFKVVKDYVPAWYKISYAASGADPGYFLGGGALISCSTSTPINHIVFLFFAEYQLY